MRALIAAVGLAGKLLGPLGLAQADLDRGVAAGGQCVCITNDVFWWVPFGWYLYDVASALPEKETFT